MSPSGEAEGPERTPEPKRAARAGRQARKQVLLRLDPQVYEALARWAGEELRSANAQIEFLLRQVPAGLALAAGVGSGALLAVQAPGEDARAG
ncbi:hypothetical protein, partial [Streptomyces sp. NPDC007369]|uniref:hypothetical protein n=1 Tax=Streptomyces sp. NPDC007369 TaxID=3154589 RepID=UPI0033DC06F5